MEFLKSILFIDIETVPFQRDYAQLTDGMKKEWQRKAKFIRKEPGEDLDPAALFAGRAGVFSEFAKVVCIGLGALNKENDQWKLRLKALTNDDEKVLLKDLSDLLARFCSMMPDMKFCGHNIKEFDMPFLCRRFIINGMPLPDCLQLSGKRPWEVTHIDTMELWKFGDNKNFTALSLLAEVLGIPSPKGDLDGSQVAGVYWQQNDLPRIARYCLQDVLTSAKVFLRLKGIHDLPIDASYAEPGMN